MLELAVTPGRPHLPPSIIFDQPDYLSNLQRIRFYAPGIPGPTLSQADTSDARRLAASGDGGEADPHFGDGRFASAFAVHQNSQSSSKTASLPTISAPVLAGRRAANSACRARQSRLFTRS